MSHGPVSRWALALLAGTALACGGASRHTPSPTGEIAFSHGFADDILVMPPTRDGHVRRLTRLRGGQFDPDWSPDGRKIVFRDSRAGINHNDEIYVMDADGSHLRNLSRNAANDWSPSWSPDGQRIVFASTRGDGRLALWLMNADGSHPHQLLPGGSDEYPAWSPDGAWIAFSRGLPQSDVWVVRPDGSGAHALTNSSDPEWQPAWSPDGSTIAYARGFEGRTRIWLMKADGRGEHRFTHVAGDAGPAWSPDGQWLAFSRKGRLHLIDAAGDAAYGLGIKATLPSWTRPR
jgi:TolB protein